MSSTNEQHNESDDLIWRKLKNVLSYSSEKVPFYRYHFDNARINVNEINSWSDFRQIPFITKHNIQEHWPSFLSTDYQNSQLIYTYTSGSTGTPLKIAMTPMERLVAARHIMDERKKWGVQFPVRIAAVGRAVHFVFGLQDEPETKRKFGSGDLLSLQIIDYTQANLEACIRSLENFQPQWIYGLPTILDRIAQHIISTRNSLKIESLCLIELAGEFTSNETRERISTAFQHSPMNQYSCQEVWGMAFECPFGGMHVLNNHINLEIIKENGDYAKPGEVGEVIITSLNRKAMPLIRYRIGDLATLVAEPCSCQNKAPLIKIISGRTTDFIVGQPNKLGTLIFGKIFAYLHKKGFDGIREFRVVQRSETFFEVWLVCPEKWNIKGEELL